MGLIKLSALIIGILVILGVGYYLISPAFIVVEVDEPFPEIVTDPEMTKEIVMDADKLRGLVPDVIMDEDMPDMEKIMSSLFMPSAHDVSGKALVVGTDDHKVLRFEDFDTINGPELHIYLATDSDATDFIDLGKIKATKGNVNYDIPPGVDLEKYDHVLVWCKPFGVLFSYAVIQ